MANAARQFKSKYDGFHRAVKVWVCRSCQSWSEYDKPKICTQCGGDEFHYFASRLEAKRYAELLLMVRVGLIRDLEVQVTFPLVVNGVKIFPRGYVADFVYYKCANGERIVEDTKADSKNDAAITALFKCKYQLMGAIHGIQIHIERRK